MCVCVDGGDLSLLHVKVILLCWPKSVYIRIVIMSGVAGFPRSCDSLSLPPQCRPTSPNTFRVNYSSSIRCYKPIWPTAPRDFSLLCSWGTLEDGTTYLLNRSVDHPLNPPVKVGVSCAFFRGCTLACRKRRLAFPQYSERPMSYGRYAVKHRDIFFLVRVIPKETISDTHK